MRSRWVGIQDGQLVVATPPQLNFMHITMQSFGQIVGQYLWQYAIDNEEEDDERISDAGSYSSPTQQQQKNILMTMMMMMVLSAQAHAKKKCKFNDNGLLNDVPDDKDEVGWLYPHLCQALGLDDNHWFDPNPSTQKSMVMLLTEINCLFSIEYEFVI